MLAECKNCEMDITKKDKMPLLSSVDLKENHESLVWKGTESVSKRSGWVCTLSLSLWLKINGLSVTQQEGRQKDSRQRKRPLCLEKKQQRNNCRWGVRIMWGWNGKVSLIPTCPRATTPTSNAQEKPTVPSAMLQPRPRPGRTMRSPHVYEWPPSLADICRGICQFQAKQKCLTIY